MKSMSDHGKGPEGKPAVVESPEPSGGLWAYDGNRFYTLKLEPGDRKTDHISWFQSLGLPDHGREYDRILRGRMIWNWHFDHFVLTFYGLQELPNRIYEMVTRYFNPNGARVVERPAATSWI